jgi:hypothetical protein
MRQVKKGASVVNDTVGLRAARDAFLSAKHALAAEVGRLVTADPEEFQDYDVLRATSASC